MKEYPEHEKLHKIQDKSQAIGNFMEWLQYEKDAVLCRYQEARKGYYEDEDDYSYISEGYYLYTVSIHELLAEYFGINTERIEKENREMLNELRKIHNNKEAQS